MSEFTEESVIHAFKDFIDIHEKGVKVFSDSIRTSETIDDVKHTLSLLVNAYFYETSLLFKMASVSVPAIMSMRKTIDQLPDKSEFVDIKSEAQSQYNKVREGLHIIKQALDDRTERTKRGQNIYG